MWQNVQLSQQNSLLAGDKKHIFQWGGGRGVHIHASDLMLVRGVVSSALHALLLPGHGLTYCSLVGKSNSVT